MAESTNNILEASKVHFDENENPSLNTTEGSVENVFKTDPSNTNNSSVRGEKFDADSSHKVECLTPMKNVSFESGDGLGLIINCSLSQSLNNNLTLPNGTHDSEYLACLLPDPNFMQNSLCSNESSNISESTSNSALSDKPRVHYTNDAENSFECQEFETNISFPSSTNEVNFSALELSALSEEPNQQNLQQVASSEISDGTAPCDIFDFPESGKLNNVSMEEGVIELPEDLQNSDETLEGEEFQDAVQFFKDPSSFQFLENIKTSDQTESLLPRDSLYVSFDPLHKKFEQSVNVQNVNATAATDSIVACTPAEVKTGQASDETDIISVTNKSTSDISPKESFSNILLTFDSPMMNKTTPSLQVVEPSTYSGAPKLCCKDELQQAIVINDITSQEIDLQKQKIEELSIKINLEQNEEVIIKDVLSTNNNVAPKRNIVLDNAPRESFGNILLSFDSPMKNTSASSSQRVGACSLSDAPTSRFYSEEELQQALKVCDLTVQDGYLKKQREMEEQFTKIDHEKDDKIQQLSKVCRALREVVEELASVSFLVTQKNEVLSGKNMRLETENQKLSDDLKTCGEDLQSVENTFSDFHKRYEQCKGMLKIFKDNEDRLKQDVEGLNKKLEEQMQMYNMLQERTEEMVDKANAEVANAKKGGDAQVAVLRAQLKKSELKISSLESDVIQVRNENEKLVGICDDLMAKVSES